MTARLEFASGLRALGLATELLHGVRLADPCGGVWEAADVHWWWRTPRRSDAVDQVSFETPAARDLYLGTGFRVETPDTTYIRRSTGPS